MKSLQEQNYVLVFDNIKKDKRFKGLGKLLVSDIISFQREGKEYFKTDKAIAYEYGISESQAQKEIKRVRQSGVVEVRYEYKPRSEGGRPIRVRYLSVKDLSIWGIESKVKRSKEDAQPKSKTSNSELSSSIYKNQTPMNRNLESTSPNPSSPPNHEMDKEQIGMLLNKIKVMGKEVDESDLQNLKNEDLHFLLYGDNGFVKIDDHTHENQHRIRIVHKGGSRFTLINKKFENDRLNLSPFDDFENYMSAKGIGFGDFSRNHYQDIKNNGLLSFKEVG